MTPEGREIARLGHTVRLMPPAYVKPFVKRQKNDAADAEAICEAAQRPSMRFVAVKDEQQQASGVVFRARDVLVRQRTQCINALRGHLTEYGWVVPKGATHVPTLGIVGDAQGRTSECHCAVLARQSSSPPRVAALRRSSREIFDPDCPMPGDLPHDLLPLGKRQVSPRQRLR